MDTIRTFLNNMFDALPKRSDVLKAKEDLYDMMMQKYHDYKKEGRSENEAIGLVISEFGNITELLEELGFSGTTVIQNEISKVQTDQIIRTYETNGRKIAWGVFIIMLGVALTIMLEVLFPVIESSLRYDVLMGLPLILMVIPAVGLFISAGMEMAAKTKPLEDDFVLSIDAKNQVLAVAEAFEPKYRNGILTGVMTIIGSAVVFIAAAIFGDDWPYLVALGIMIVAAAVWLLITRGIIRGIHSRLLKRGDYSPEMKKVEKLTDIVGGIVFPLTAGVYLLISFLSGRWGITWIIWPIVGIMFGIFVATVEAIQKNKK